MQKTGYDVIVVGGGIAGVSAAYELAAHASVLLVEREAQLAYHSTGRSAAMLTENYGNESIRLLTIASREFFERPPSVFGDNALMRSRGMLWVARADQRERLAVELELGQRFVPTIHRLDASRARQACPALQAAYVDGAMLEPDAMDLDVNAIHQGFLKGFRQRGGTVTVNAEVTALHRDASRWRVETRSGAVTAGTLVNAAGAWADEIARLAGASPIELVPKRRTAILFDAREGVDCGKWPCVIDVDEKFYFKPESGRLMGSPADATPIPPCDVQAEELDIALAVDRIERATTLKVRQVSHRWAGLRSFVRDGSPVVGFDPAVPGFFWLAGQGGYGIMTSPALARVTAGLMIEGSVPADLVERGLTAEALSPQRLRP